MKEMLMRIVRSDMEIEARKMWTKRGRRIPEYELTRFWGRLKRSSAKGSIGGSGEAA